MILSNSPIRSIKARKSDIEMANMRECNVYIILIFKQKEDILLLFDYNKYLLIKID